MSELHPDADLVKVTRTTTTYEPVDTKTRPAPVRRRRVPWLWVVAGVALIAIVIGTLYYVNLQQTPAVAQQSAVAADQGRAQTLSQQAATAQQSADQSQQQARTLTADAAHARAAAKRAGD